MRSTDIHGDPLRQTEVFRINCEPAHATDTVPYDTVEHARQGAVSGDWSLSPRYCLLTGPGEEWQLTVYRNMREAAADADAFYKPGFTGAEEQPYTGSGSVQDRAHADYGCGWRTVTLPASWQTQGFDFPIYTNIATPWKGVYGNEGADKADKDLVPAVPTVFNPVGLYRRQFDIDPAWLREGGRIYVSFQGVESAMFLYVNGCEVGYAEDSYDAHDFDLTPYLNPNGKDNLMAVRVHRWCGGSWLEDQDMLRMGGIFRDVFLYAAPALAIRDYKVETPLHNDYTDATLSLSVQIADKSGEGGEGYALEALLFDHTGAPVLAPPLKETAPAVAAGGEVCLSLSRELTAPRLWSDEDPYLYTLVLALYDGAGRLVQTVSQQLGVREISFTKTRVDGDLNNVTKEYGRILLNGKPLLFRGVNRHDNDPATGRYVSPALYEQDIRIMKEHNINAVRTSHYPDDRHFYRLCDKYGILVLAETNAESHALQWDSDVMASHFTALYRDRLTSNIQAQKNRACVVMWSLGNECGDTPNSKMFQRAIQEVLRPLDSTRPVHYEGLQNRGGVDVYSNMYPEVTAIADRGEAENRMPYVLCEYVFAQGNSVGNLQEYWNELRRYDNMLGAFIWDFVDKAVETPLPSGRLLTADKGRPDAAGVFDYYGTGTYYAYGGDWGEAIHDGSYLACGLCSPDRRVQPEMQEVAYVYQPIRFEDAGADRSRIRVINDHRFTAADKFTLRWELMCDGTAVEEGEIPCSVGPMERGSVTVPYTLPKSIPAGSEWFLNLQAVLKEEEGCLKAGHVIAREQFALSVTSRPVPAKDPAASSLRAAEEGDSLTLTGRRFAVTFDKAAGMIRRYVYDGQELITGCSPNFWRAAMDSDHQNSGWRSAGASAAADSLTLDREGGTATVTAVLRMPESPSSRLTYRYTVYGTGEIAVAVTLSPAADSGELLKVGTEWLLPAGLDRITFYGEGPADSFADRRQGAKVGIYSTTAAAEFYPYARPQTCGNHTGVRWIALTGDGCPVGLAAVGENPLEAGALPYRVKDFAGKAHPYEMAAETGYTVLNTDMLSAGLGGANCGPAALPQYRLFPDRTYAYAFTLLPFEKGADLTELSKPWRAAAAGASVPERSRD